MVEMDHIYCEISPGKGQVDFVVGVFITAAKKQNKYPETQISILLSLNESWAIYKNREVN